MPSVSRAAPLPCSALVSMRKRRMRTRANSAATKNAFAASSRTTAMVLSTAEVMAFALAPASSPKSPGAGVYSAADPMCQDGFLASAPIRRSGRRFEQSFELRRVALDAGKCPADATREHKPRPTGIRLLVVRHRPQQSIGGKAIGPDRAERRRQTAGAEVGTYAISVLGRTQPQSHR